VRFARNEPCPCGSGAKYKRCHGATRDGERALERRLDALAEARDLGVLFPWLRPADEAVARAAGLVHDDGPAAADIARLVDADDRRRLVDAYATEFPAEWEGVCAEVGDADAAADALVAGALRAAVAERSPRSSELFAAVERSPIAVDEPLEALALALRPASIWSIVEAVTAAEHATARAGGAGDVDVLLDEAARERLGPEHVERVRALSRFLAVQLPAPGFPRASAVLAEACALVEADVEAAADVAAAALGIYIAYLTLDAVRARAA
jgi:hypothetical protein